MLLLLPRICTGAALHKVESERGLLALGRSGSLGWSDRLGRPQVKQINFSLLGRGGWWRRRSRCLHLLLHGSSGFRPLSASFPSSLLLLGPSLGLVELFTILVARLRLYLSHLLLLCDLLRLLCGRFCRSGFRLISRCLFVDGGLRRYVLELLVVALRLLASPSTPGSACGLIKARLLLDRGCRVGGHVLLISLR